jgi:hypothetical protein
LAVVVLAVVLVLLLLLLVLVPVTVLMEVLSSAPMLAETAIPVRSVAQLV